MPASNYCVTFRIANQIVNGRTYSDRYSDFISDLREESMGFWDGTTSFFLVESRLNTYDFAERACRRLSERHDIVIIFDPSDMSAVQFGPVPEAEILASFLPLIRKAA